METFTHGLLTNSFSTGVITKLETSGSLAAVELLHTCMNAAATSPLCSITDLIIVRSELSSNEERIHLFELISHMPHLQKLNISGSDLRNAPGSPYCACRDTDGLLKFLQYLPHSKVTSLDISRTGLEYFLEQSPLAQDYCAAIQALISPPSNLRELDIGPLDNSCREGNLTMISLASSPSSLRKLSLYLSRDGVYLLNAFQTDNNLLHLEICKEISLHLPALLPDIVRIIQYYTTLETLCLRNIDFEANRGVLMDIATTLQGNKTLNHLHFYSLYLDLKYMQSILEELQAVDSRIDLPQRSTHVV